jgi:hypothetical protein
VNRTTFVDQCGGINSPKTIWDLKACLVSFGGFIIKIALTSSNRTTTKWIVRTIGKYVPSVNAKAVQSKAWSRDRPLWSLDKL